MQQTSSLYPAAVQQQIAPQGYIRITFGLTDTDAAATCAPPETTPEAFYSRPDTMLLEDGAPRATYATFEPGRMLADGSQLIPPKPGSADLRPDGFVSAALCGTDGAFAAADVPGIVLTFSKMHTVPGLTFTFDPTCGDWPGEMNLTASREGAVFFTADYTPDAAVYTTPDAIERFDALTFTFPRMTKPYRRMRLQQLMFGFGLVFDNRLVEKAVHKLDVDPISRRLPTNTFDFTIVNINTLTGTGGQYLYDPDNASGIYKYISEQNPVKVEYDQYLAGGMTWKDVAANTWAELELNGWREVYEGGITEWVPGGRYYLTGQPTVDGLSASFKAQDALSGLDGTYYKGVYAPAGRTLYQLALDVLEDSGLAPFSGTAPPWKLWEGLADFMTTAPLPVKKHKELLQLIAHAACCVLYTDREGYIRIEPANDVQDNFKLDFHTMLARPKVSQIPTLWAVECPAYTYAPEAEASELHKENYTVNGTLKLHLTFSQAADVTVDVTGATVAAKAVFAAAADLTLTGNGEAVVTVTGRKLESSARTVTAPVEKPDENGSVETLDNPLVTDAVYALAVAEWVRDWLLLRNTYEFEYRGSPELDPGDLIWLESQFAPFAAPARVLKNELTFSGGLKGKMIAKRMVDEE